MPIEIPTTRDGIMALYEEVKPELSQFLADNANSLSNSFGMARARELEYTLQHEGIPKELEPFAVQTIKRIKSNHGHSSIFVAVDDPIIYAKYIKLNLQWPFMLGEKMAALRDALKEYKGADKAEILGKSVHGDNISGKALSAARGAYKYIPGLGHALSAVARSLDSVGSHTLEQAIGLYDKVVLQGRKISEVSGEKMQAVSAVPSAAEIADAIRDASAAAKVAAEISPASTDTHESVVSPKMSPDKAAIKIQAAYRGYNARNHFEPPVKAAAGGAGAVASEAAFVPEAVKVTKKYNEIKALQARFITDAKAKNYKLLTPTVDLLIKNDPENVTKFIQDCIDKKLGGPGFAEYLARELDHTNKAISAVKDREKMAARAAKQRGR